MKAEPQIKLIELTNIKFHITRLYYEDGSDQQRIDEETKKKKNWDDKIK